jgi:hypothetical protein
VPRFDYVTFARVTSNKDYEEYGRVDVQFLNDGGLAGGVPLPVWVIEDGAEVKPEEGDMVLIGFVQGNKDIPYLIGYVKDHYACGHMIRIDKDKIIVRGTKEDLITITEGKIIVSYGEAQLTIENGLITMTSVLHLPHNPDVDAKLVDHEQRITRLEGFH